LVPCIIDVVDVHSSRLLVLDRSKLGVGLRLVMVNLVDMSHLGLVPTEVEVEERLDLRLLLAVESRLTIRPKVEAIGDRDYLGWCRWLLWREACGCWEACIILITPILKMI